MKLSKPFLYLSLCLGCCFLPTARSQEVFDPAGDSLNFSVARSIRIYAEYYEITTLEHAEIMSEPRQGNDDSKLRDDLLKKAKAGKATLLESQTVVSRSGERATTKSITEFIFPTEYDVVIPQDTDKKKAEKKDPNKSEEPRQVIPTAFETRDLGSILEVEPILGEDGNTIDISVRPQITYHVGDTLWGTDPKTKIQYKMPTFYTVGVNTSAVLTKGKFHFIAAMNPKSEHGNGDTSKKILMFIKADILKAGH